jgi:hypothetical protein
MAALPELCAGEVSVSEAYAFGRVGCVGAHSESALAACSPPSGNAALVVASSRYGLVFFADALGVCALRTEELLAQAAAPPADAEDRCATAAACDACCSVLAAAQALTH